MLRFLAAAVNAKAVVEIGTGAGVASGWLLAGMRPDGVLTSVDVEVEHQQLARTTLSDAGVAANRTRLIAGVAADVLPRLTDGGYDLVLICVRGADRLAFLAEAVRLLRPGGVLVFPDALEGRVTNAGARDPESVAQRELLATIRDDERLVPVLLPVGNGVLAAAKR